MSTQEISKAYLSMLNEAAGKLATKDLGKLTWHDAMAAVEGDKTWRLPTIEELKWIYQNQDKVDKTFDASYYWSSTEASATNAYFLNFTDGGRYSITNAYTLHSRAFKVKDLDALKIKSKK